MPHRTKKSLSHALSFNLKLGTALRDKFRQGYSLADFRSDLTAGIIVGMVAIPLAMALAIASGVSPENGLYTVIVAGALVALLGGSRFQVTGPTAAFVVVLAPVAQKYGLSGLLVAGLMAGILLVIMGVGRMGRLIRYVPYPVTTGFTTGIAVVIATLQLKDFLGLKIASMPDAFFEKIAALVDARSTFSPSEFGVALLTLSLLLLMPRISTRVPAPLVALLTASVGVLILKQWVPNLEIVTIGDRFSFDVDGILRHGIPQSPPHFAWPWQIDDATFSPSLDWIKSLVPSAFAIAMLGAIESLLSAVVADGLAQTKHDPDTELVALGIGNIVGPFFGGIAATGAIARTATNIRFGARSPLAAVIHAIFTLLVVLLFAPFVAYLPMAALSALLLFVAYHMSEAKHFIHILKRAPRGDVVVLLLCFGLTVVFDMVVGVTVGVVLAALLFMREMAASTSTTLFAEGHHPKLKEPLPPDVVLYEIAGPLFFGAAEQAAEALSDINHPFRVIILVMDEIPIMDATGLVAFESTIKKLTDNQRHVFLTGVRPKVQALLKRSTIVAHNRAVTWCANIDEAIEQTRTLSR